MTAQRAGWVGGGPGPSDYFAGQPVATDMRDILTPEETTATVFELSAQLDRSQDRAEQRERRARLDELASKRDEIYSRCTMGLIQARSAAETIARASALADAQDAREAAEERRRAKDMTSAAFRFEDALADVTGREIWLRQQLVDERRRSAGRSSGRDVIRSQGRHVSER